MTRTDLPKILVSTMYQAADLNSLSSSSYKRRDSTYVSALEDTWIDTKGHCQIFNTEAVQKPKYNTIEMEYQYRKADRYTGHPEVDWNAISQHQRHRIHRFSSPDLLNLQVSPQPLTSDRVGEVLPKRRTRARSTPQVQTNLIPVRIKGSPQATRSDHEFQRSPKLQHKRTELSPRKEPSYAIGKTLTDGVPDKMSASPHVKCRVDIKPDEATFEQHGQKPSTPRVDLPWLRYASGDHQSLTVPLHFSISRTPTPTEPFMGDYRTARHYSQNVSTAYMPPIKTQRMPDQRELREYYEREQRARSSPNVASKYFHEKDMGKYVSSPKTRTYYQDDYFMIPNPTDSPKVHYVQDQKANTVHTIPVRPYFTQMDPYHETASIYPKSCPSHEPGQYIIQTPPAHSFYGDDPRTYQVQKVPPRIFYVGDSYEPPLESEIPAYLPQDVHHAHVVQPESHDWYGSDVSGFSTYYPFSLNSQVTPTRVRQEPMLASWYDNSHAELTRTEADPKPYSRSWDNILSTQIEREQPVHRGKSDENLLFQGKQVRLANGRRKPVVVNLSSSPRRYAALSLSDNSLIEKDSTDTRSTSSKQWVVTPEITITDNDIKPGKSRVAEERSVSCDVLDAKSADEDAAYHESKSFSMKEKTYHSASLQQSLEQLDKLLADLVIDYKPSSSGGPSADLVDQLEKLIYEDEATSPGRMSSRSRSKSNTPLDKQPTSIRLESHGISERSCNGLQSTEECSPDQSPDEDDTMICSNNKCRRIETLFNACLYFKSCHSCYTYYCSRNCRREDWDIHKASCLYGRTASVCRHIIKYCRETAEVHKAFSRIAKVGFLSRGRGVLFLGFPNPGSSTNFLQCGLESLLMHPTYLSLRELDSFTDNLGDYCKELQEAGKEYDPNECFLLNVSIAVGEQMADGPSPRVQAPTVRKYAKVALASYSPERKVQRRESDMETLILTPPPGTADIDKEGEEGRKAREICFINIQRELRIRGVFLRHEYPHVYQKLCEFVESNRRFTPTTIYPIDKRTGNQFMCMIMAASEPRTLDWVATPHLLDDII